MINQQDSNHLSDLLTNDVTRRASVTHNREPTGPAGENLATRHVRHTEPCVVTFQAYMATFHQTPTMPRTDSTPSDVPDPRGHLANPMPVASSVPAME